jgi:hypothetical protein
MKRAFAIVASACLILAVGCSTAYDTRLGKTLDEMRYKKRLDDNLVKAIEKGKLEELHIYVRPPKNLKGPTQTFALAVIEPGRFDLENSFIDQDKQESMHILVRQKKAKAPPSKKKAAAPTEAAPRGEFTTDVIEIVKSAYGAELESKQFKPDAKKHGARENNFKSATLDLAAKEVRVYFFGDKNGPYEVALIFDYPKEEKSKIDSKIRLSLEAFAVGPAAVYEFSGGDAEGGEEGGGVPPPI